MIFSYYVMMTTIIRVKEQCLNSVFIEILFVNKKYVNKCMMYMYNPELQNVCSITHTNKYI